MGYEEGQSDGYEAGYQDCEEVHRDPGEQWRELEQSLGVTLQPKNRSNSTTANAATQTDLLPSPTPHVNISVQTAIDAPIYDSPLHGDVSTQTSANPSPPHVDAVIQAPDPPPLAVLPQIMTVPPLNWADDAASLPTRVLPSPLLPRDFSGLRSPNLNPFSSLQHRSKCFTYYSCRSCRSHSHFNFNSPHYDSFKSFRPHFQSKTYSHLHSALEI